MQYPKSHLFRIILLTILECLLILQTSESKNCDKIVGGVEVKLNELPYQVSIRRSSKELTKLGSILCGGIIYNTEYIITAAHCFFSNNGSQTKFEKHILVVSGDHKISETEDTEHISTVKKIIIHQNYSDRYFQQNDIALLRLSTPLVFTKAVNSIRIAPRNHVSKGKALTSGWGTTSRGGKLSDTLKKAWLNIVDDENCEHKYGWDENDIAESMVCAAANNTDSCQGDSGGPLVCEDIGEKYLCGIVSFGIGCADKYFPGVYTEVSYYVDFIQNYAGSQSCVQ